MNFFKRTSIFFVFFGYAFRDFDFDRILFDDNFSGGGGEKHLFPHGGLLMLVEGFGSKTRCLKIV